MRCFAIPLRQRSCAAILSLTSAPGRGPAPQISWLTTSKPGFPGYRLPRADFAPFERARQACRGRNVG